MTRQAGKLCGTHDDLQDQRSGCALQIHDLTVFPSLLPSASQLTCRVAAEQAAAAAKALAEELQSTLVCSERRCTELEAVLAERQSAAAVHAEAMRELQASGCRGAARLAQHERGCISMGDWCVHRVCNVVHVRPTSCFHAALV